MILLIYLNSIPDFFVWLIFPQRISGSLSFLFRFFIDFSPTGSAYLISDHFGNNVHILDYETIN